MTRLKFLIEGSQGDEYSVAFEVADGVVRAFCTCVAGASGQFCKHRTALLDGDISRLRSSNAGDVTHLEVLIRGSELSAAYAQVVAATKALEQAKRALEAAKKHLVKVTYR